MDPISFTRRGLTRLAAIALLSLGAAAPAMAALTVTPITWDIIGLDSNAPLLGPQDFPFAARVCTTTAVGPNTVRATFNWDDNTDRYNGHPYINLRAGTILPPTPNTPFQIDLGVMAANTCKDAYFEVRVTRDSLAFDQLRRYHIVAEEMNGLVPVGGTAVSSPRPRAAYVERLVSQSRNSISEMRWQVGSGVFPPLASFPPHIPLLPNLVGAGSSFTLVVGGIYDIQVVGATATQGYEQFESFISFNRTIFQILDVRSSYDANSAPLSRVPNWNDKLYADACLWQADVQSPAYRSCRDDGKTGGNFRTTYRVQILGGAGTQESLNTLVHDFSGSSYHYNADFSSGVRFVNILDPTTATIGKSFTPSSIPVNGLSTLSITINNPNAFAVSGFSFNDALPTNVTIANVPLPLATTSGCGSVVAFTPALAAGGTAINASDITVGANSSCTISVRVTSSVVNTYNNTITAGNFLINGVSTGNASNTAQLTVTNAPAAPSGCTPGATFARWSFNAPPAGGTITAPSVDAGNLATASAAAIAGTANVGAVGMVLALGSAWSGAHVTEGALGAAIPRSQQEYFEFAIDTSGIASVTLSFDYARSQQGPRNAGIDVSTSATASLVGTVAASVDMTAGTSSTTTFTTGLNPLGMTYFRIYFGNSSQDVNGHNGLIDNVVLSACAPPRILKAFSPNPVSAGQNSVLTFTINNLNQSATTPTPATITGVAFNDTLPAGMVLGTPALAVAPSGCGTPTFTPALAPGGSVIGFSDGTMALAAAPPSTTPSTCTFAVNVTTATAGSRTNVTGNVSATVTGANITPTGSATASLATIEAPQIEKIFGPNPIQQGGVSTMTFLISNPNPSDAISSVAFTDNPFPAGMTVASPTGASVSGCGFTLPSANFAPVAGASSISFSGGTIAAGGTCTVTVDVTSSTVGISLNTTQAVTHVIGGQTIGTDTDSAALVVEAPSPGIALSKTLNGDGVFLGPWYSYLPVPLNYDVYYRFVIENVGDVTLSMPVGGWVTDALVAGEEACQWTNDIGGSVMPLNTLTPGQTAVCIIGPFDAVFPGLANTATATGIFGGNPFSSPSDTAEYRTFGLTVVKSPDQLTFSAPGEVIDYLFAVTNTGGATLAGPIVVTDLITSTNPDVPLLVSCPAVSTVGDLDNFLDADNPNTGPNEAETITCTASHLTTADDEAAGVITNQATASSSDPESFTALSNVVNVFFNNTADPFLVVSKSISPNVTPGGTATFTVVVTNAGTVPTTAEIGLTDPLPSSVTYVPNSASGTNWACTLGGGNTLGCLYSGPALAPGASTTVTFDVTVALTAETIANTVVASGGGDPDCASPIPDPPVAHCVGSVIASTVPVTLSDVESVVENGMLVVRFGTAMEAGTLGFRVVTDRPGEVTGRQPLTAGIVRAHRSTLHPQRYEVRGSFAGQSQIWIEEIAVNGKPTRHGPFPVGVTTGERNITVATDWNAIRAEQAAFRIQQRQARIRAGTIYAADISVDTSGWVRVRYEDLVDAGINWSNARPDQIRLSRGGVSVPVSYSGPANFGPGGSLSFLGEAVKGSLYTTTAMYRLEVETGSAAPPVATVYAHPGALADVTAMRDVFELAPDLYYDFASPTGDPWYAFDVTRVNTPLASATRVIDLSSRAAGSTGERLTVDLYGGLDFPETPDHSVRIKLNGQIVATHQFDGITRAQISVDLPDGLLVSGNNTVVVELVADTGVYADIVIVNGIRVEYTRKLTAVDNRLDFEVPAGAPGVPVAGDAIFATGVEDDQPTACAPATAGCVAFRVDGLGSSDVVVVRQRASGAVDELTSVEMTPDGAGFQLRFASQSAAGDRYWIEPAIGQAASAVQPGAGTVDPLAGGPATYLIISHPSFMSGLAPLVAARQAEGLSVRVVDVENLYRWYTQGTTEAEAIRAAIADARTRLGTLYVLLVGGDTYDYFNFEGSNSMSFVPTLYRRTDWLVTFAPADSAFADVDNDGRSDLAIGRFPVRSMAELDAIVGKTLTYAQANHPRKLMRLSDRTDGDADFQVLTNPIIASLPGWQDTVVSLQDYPAGNAGVQQARAAMVSAVNSGQALMTYFGHSAPNSWTREGLVNSSLVYNGLFSNATLPTVAWQLGCWGAYFVDPYYNTIAHGLLLQSNGGGAAAVIGASGLTEVGSDMVWMGVMPPYLPNARIGDAIRQSQNAINGLGPQVRDISVGGTLLGDPTLRLRQ